MVVLSAPPHCAEASAATAANSSVDGQTVGPHAVAGQTVAPHVVAVSLVSRASEWVLAFVRRVRSA
jgi:hypothetical protein